MPNRPQTDLEQTSKKPQSPTRINQQNMISRTPSCTSLPQSECEIDEEPSDFINFDDTPFEGAEVLNFDGDKPKTQLKLDDFNFDSEAETTDLVENSDKNKTEDDLTPVNSDAEFIENENQAEFEPEISVEENIHEIVEKNIADEQKHRNEPRIDTENSSQNSSENSCETNLEIESQELINSPKTESSPKVETLTLPISPQTTIEDSIKSQETFISQASEIVQSMKDYYIGQSGIYKRNYLALIINSLNNDVQLNHLQNSIGPEHCLTVNRFSNNQVMTYLDEFAYQLSLLEKQNSVYVRNPATARYVRVTKELVVFVVYLGHGNQNCEKRWGVLEGSNYFVTDPRERCGVDFSVDSIVQMFIKYKDQKVVEVDSRRELRKLGIYDRLKTLESTLGLVFLFEACLDAKGEENEKTENKISENEKTEENKTEEKKQVKTDPESKTELKTNERPRNMSTDSCAKFTFRDIHTPYNVNYELIFPEAPKTDSDGKTPDFDPNSVVIQMNCETSKTSVVESNVQLTKSITKSAESAFEFFQNLCAESSSVELTPKVTRKMLEKSNYHEADTESLFSSPENSGSNDTDSDVNSDLSFRTDPSSDSKYISKNSKDSKIITIANKTSSFQQDYANFYRVSFLKFRFLVKQSSFWVEKGRFRPKKVDFGQKGSFQLIFGSKTVILGHFWPFS